jgi:hypothetical protein
MGRNTTKLIRQWSMAGAGRDGSGRFRSPQELRELFGRNRTPSQTGTPLLMTLSGEQEWRPLPGDAGGEESERV